MTESQGLREELRETILVVDDTPANIDLLIGILSDNYMIKVATSGEKALKIASDHSPDLVLLDIMMPDMPGDEVCRRLKANPQTRDIPVIFVTAKISSEDELAGFELGAVDYITKPFNPPVVEARIRTQMALLRQKRVIERKHLELEKEKALSDKLLRNVLPESIANRLKSHSEKIADRFPEASVLFADIVGFSRLAQDFQPLELVNFLAELFSGFDEIIETHSLEKIKTVGDSYMAAGGVPTYRADHLISTAKASIDMAKFVNEYGKNISIPIAVRIGFSVGPLVAGIIGNKKFSYDLWGETVNIASRMESHGEPGRIQVTHEVRNALIDKFSFIERGEIIVKGQGPMNTFWLDRQEII